MKNFKSWFRAIINTRRRRWCVRMAQKSAFPYDEAVKIYCFIYLDSPSLQPRHTSTEYPHKSCQ